MKTLKFHPACLLFPKLPDDELNVLAEDIRLNGLRNPIVLYQGMILDGRNRYLACKIAGVKPRFVQWSGSGSPLQWVISENLVRRHLTASQRSGDCLRRFAPFGAGSQAAATLIPGTRTKR